jgi:8-oxo-dGTP pyrophosphatase MutT (NUDIX family)
MATQVVAALLIRDGRVLLGLRAAHRRSAPGCWDLIGGHVEPGETPAEALVREVLEELGVSALGATPAGQIDFNDVHDGPSSLLLYHVAAWRGGEPRLANDEHVRLEWFAPEEAVALPNLALAEYRALIAGLGA